MVGLGDLPGGVFFSVADGVSADGSVVVGASRLGLGQRGVPLDERRRDGRPGRPARGSFYSTANGVSADGSVVVGQQRLRLGLRRRSAGRAAAAWSAWATCRADF